jgi:hypothetical protein
MPARSFLKGWLSGKERGFAVRAGTDDRNPGKIDN